MVWCRRSDRVEMKRCLRTLTAYQLIGAFLRGVHVRGFEGPRSRLPLKRFVDMLLHTSAEHLDLFFFLRSLWYAVKVLQL